MAGRRRGSAARFPADEAWGVTQVPSQVSFSNRYEFGLMFFEMTFKTFLKGR
jgi:hypothetical protein